jgi:cytochrome c oxidase subunit 2
MPEESTPRRERKRTVQQMVVVGIIATAIGIAIGLTIHWFPPADSTQADKIDTLWDVLIIATVPVFVLVTVIVCFAVHRVPHAPGRGEPRRPPIHGNTSSRSSGPRSRRSSSSAS